MTEITEVNDGDCFKLPDHGEDGFALHFILPTGERVDLMYKGYYGTVDISTYRPAGTDEKAKDHLGFVPHPCEAINLVDKKSKDDGTWSSLHPAEPVYPGDGEGYILRSSQIILSVGPNKGDR